MLLVWSVLVALVANVFVVLQRWTEVLVTLSVGLVGFGLYGLVRLVGGGGEGGGAGVMESEGTGKESGGGVTVVTSTTRVWESGGGVDWPWVVFWVEVAVVVVLAVVLAVR